MKLIQKLNKSNHCNGNVFKQLEARQINVKLGTVCISALVHVTNELTFDI